MLYPDDLQGVTDDMIDGSSALEQFALLEFALLLSQFDTITMDDMANSANKVKGKADKQREIAQEESEEIFTELLALSNRNDKPIYEKAGTEWPGEDFGKESMDNALNSLDVVLKKTFSDIGYTKLVNGKVDFNPVYKAYVDAVTQARFEMSSGLFERDEIIQRAIKSCIDGGLRTINYESGITNHIDVAIRRAVMTGVNQLSADLNDQTVKALGTDYVEVTAHAGARPTHQVWQGRVYKIHGRTRRYPNLYEATHLGQGDGLCGWNCRHNYYAFIPGVSERAYSNDELANIDPPDRDYNGKIYSYYDATQRQRAIETAMRRTKRDILMQKGVGNSEKEQQARARLIQQRKEYKKFCRAMRIHEKIERAWTFGYDK